MGTPTPGIPSIVQQVAPKWVIRHDHTMSRSMCRGGRIVGCPINTATVHKLVGGSASKME